MAHTIKNLRGPECMYAETEKYLLSKENNTKYKTEPYFKSDKSDVEYVNCITFEM